MDEGAPIIRVLLKIRFFQKQVAPIPSTIKDRIRLHVSSKLCAQKIKHSERKNRSERLTRRLVQIKLSANMLDGCLGGGPNVMEQLHVYSKHTAFPIAAVQFTGIVTALRAARVD